MITPEKLQELTKLGTELERDFTKSIFWQTFVEMKKKDPLAYLRHIFSPEGKPN